MGFLRRWLGGSAVDATSKETSLVIESADSARKKKKKKASTPAEDVAAARNRAFKRMGLKGPKKKD